MSGVVAGELRGVGGVSGGCLNMHSVVVDVE